jgi:hypothetical protein
VTHDDLSRLRREELFSTVKCDCDTGSGESKATMALTAVGIDVLATGLAFITCYAIAEAIALLLEVNDRLAKRTVTDS